jgi:hypothetical protein
MKEKEPIEFFSLEQSRHEKLIRKATLLNFEATVVVDLVAYC